MSNFFFHQGKGSHFWTPKIRRFEPKYSTGTHSALLGSSTFKKSLCGLGVSCFTTRMEVRGMERVQGWEPQ